MGRVAAAALVERGRLGRQRAARRPHGAALDDAQTAVSTDPVSATALWELSEIHLALRRPAAARADLVRATARQPDNPETWQRLGEFDLRYGRPPRRRAS